MSVAAKNLPCLSQFQCPHLKSDRDLKWPDSDLEWLDVFGLLPTVGGGVFWPSANSGTWHDVITECLQSGRESERGVAGL